MGGGQRELKYHEKKKQRRKGEERWGQRNTQSRVEPKNWRVRPGNTEQVNLTESGALVPEKTYLSGRVSGRAGDEVTKNIAQKGKKHRAHPVGGEHRKRIHVSGVLGKQRAQVIVPPRRKKLIVSMAAGKKRGKKKQKVGQKKGVLQTTVSGNKALYWGKSPGRAGSDIRGTLEIPGCPR